MKILSMTPQGNIERDATPEEIQRFQADEAAHTAAVSAPAAPSLEQKVDALLAAQRGDLSKIQAVEAALSLQVEAESIKGAPLEVEGV